MDDPPGEVTKLLRHAALGCEVARDELFRLIYDDLHTAAHRVLRQRGHAEFQTTDLFHESILRFQDARVLEKYSENRRVFFAVAIRAMHQVLIDRYRRRETFSVLPADQLVVDQVILSTEAEFGVSFQALTDALDWLHKQSPRQHAALLHRYYGGLTIAEVAALLEVSEGTIERDCRLGRARLLHRLKEHPGEP
jgi:RNA polymerase sigma factor (TIGR02999 family)